MSVRKPASAPALGSNLDKVDAHQIQDSEYNELPELTDEMLKRSTINRGGRPRLASRKVLVSVRYSPRRSSMGMSL